MAAIIEPRRLSTPVGRPTLRLVGAHDGRPVEVPVELGITPRHVAAAVVALLVAMVLVLAIGNGALAGLAPGPSAAPAGAPAATSSAAGASAQVTVEAGDTLWSIARRVQPTGDVRPLVDQLVATYGSSLQPGQQLTVPD